MTMVENTKMYDVAILGSGIAGSTLAAILARNQLRVLLIEAGVHPRLAIGESLVPETSMRFKVIALRYGVPEIAALGTFHKIRDFVGPSSGVKRSFAFAYHREGEPHRASETNELPTLTAPFGPDPHLFRQDVDAWLTAVALRYGADVRQETRIKNLEFQKDKVVLTTDRGQTFTAACVIDGTGYKSLIANMYGLRDKEPRFTTDTRTIFTHMVDVPSYDLIGPKREEHGMPVPLGESTLHHVSDGGWIWVIPFDNHRDSTNPLCSVGLTLDRRKHPETGMDGEEEFRRWVNRYPSMARHFAKAKAVRPWVSTGRLQYSSKEVCGDRFFLLPHAAGFIDALYSSGVSQTAAVIDLLSAQLLECAKTGDYSRERFADIGAFMQRTLDHFDLMVSRSFDSFHDYSVWNAWMRLWMVGNVMGTWGPLAAYVRYHTTKDRSYLDCGGPAKQRGMLSSQHPEFVAMRDESSADVQAMVDGKITAAEAGKRILHRIATAPFLPPYTRFGDAKKGYPFVLTLLPACRFLYWYRFRSPPRWQAYTGFSYLTYGWLVLKEWARVASKGWRLFRQATRDTLWAWNGDWKHHNPHAVPPLDPVASLPDRPAASEPMKAAEPSGVQAVNLGP
jgi:tetracycline 7-halogenase / FADH2 O2-dependent halogenase